MGRKQCAVLTAALLLTGLTGTPAAAQDNPGADPANPAETVTLITGDRVTVLGDRVAAVHMATGREQVRYWQYRLNGHDYVVPDDAVRDLMQDKLDKRLFDVTGLVQQDYDDAHEPAVPTIVTNTAARGLTAGVQAVYTPKTEAAKQWRERSVAREAAPRKVWLNGRVRPALDQSVPQVGAPQAWQAGFRGDGVKVAVLDTGYDAGHPDLKSIVDNAVDFTGEGIKDTVGHGTHVASTIAGSGAASGGRFKGVAPGAHLLIGKVLGEFGGREDWIVNGMRWAVQQGAKVVNMSLGGGVTDGTDLMSQAVNQLSESSGVLFVIAAGNSGVRESVGSPGAADKALTVANVTKSDVLSTTSSQGPRAGDFGLKPEIAAPGTDIVAARAAGTFTEFSVNEFYTKISGTSMATPHVAGAAAILAQQHPDWTGEQIKNTLIGSAKRLPGIDTFAQGAGRLDVARGVLQQVRAEGLAGFGAMWGVGDVSREITYSNSGSKPVTLALDLDVPHRELFTVDKSVTVPASGSAIVTVSTRGSSRPVGDVTGVLRARAGDVLLNTPLTAQFNGDKRTLTVKVPPRSGTPLQALVIAQNEQTGLAQIGFTDNDTVSFTVPAGSYRVLGQIIDSAFTDTMFAQHADVSADTSISVGTASGKPVTVGIDDPAARAQSGGGMGITSDPDLAGPAGGTALLRGGAPGGSEFTVAGPPMRGLSFASLSYWSYPWAITHVNGAGGYEFTDTYAPWDMGFTGDLTARLVDVGEADTESIEKAGDVSGAIALITPRDWDDPGYPSSEQMLGGIELLKQKGAKAVISYFNPAADAGPDARPALPTVMAFRQTDLQGAQALMKQRTVEATLSIRANSPVSYFLADKVDGGLPGGHDFRFSKASLGQISRQLTDTMKPGTYRFGGASWALGELRAGADIESKWPQQRVDYVSPGAALTMFDTGGFTDDTAFDYETTLPVTLKAGEKRSARVFAAPFGPELTTPPTSRQDGKPVPWAYRSGDRITLAIPMFADSDPATASQFDVSNVGSTVLLKDGKEIARRGDRPALGAFDVPRGPGRFTLIADAARAAGNLDPVLSPKVHSEWTFQAGKGTQERAALPLLDIRYDLNLDARNTAHGPVTGTVTVAHQPGARSSWVRSVNVEVSYDDGKTWQRVKTYGNRLEIPAGPAGYASLRASASDLDGNTVTETITRAYAVK
ncbi:S8 family serine peptidase [Actinocrispum sp. NPDC049592]|uniref:S8 family peptidase n=1 Tax=Actinocrispum sp. NPDC049592 TaxID=3154835 RepID=UPI00343D2C4E